MSDSPKSDGRLFSNRDKTTDKHPSYKGYTVVTPEQVAKLQLMISKGMEPRLQVAAWPRTAKSSGDRFVYLATEVWVPESQQRNGQSRQQNNQSDGFDNSDIPF